MRLFLLTEWKIHLPEGVRAIELPDRQQDIVVWFLDEGSQVTAICNDFAV